MKKKTFVACEYLFVSHEYLIIAHEYLIYLFFRTPQSEEIFLDMFEDEYRELQVRYSRLSLIRPPCLPRNYGHIREVDFGKKEK